MEPSDPNSLVQEKTDKAAMSMIYQGIPEDVLLSLADKKTAKEVWEIIKTLCQCAEQVKQDKIQSLKSKFAALSMKDNEQIDEFHIRLNGLVTNIRALGEDMVESYVVKKLLRAVPVRFLHITSTMEQLANLETLIVEEAIGSLKAHEERIKGKQETAENQLLLTEKEWVKHDNGEGKLLLTCEEWPKRTSGENQQDTKVKEILIKLR